MKKIIALVCISFVGTQLMAQKTEAKVIATQKENVVLTMDQKVAADPTPAVAEVMDSRVVDVKAIDTKNVSVSATPVVVSSEVSQKAAAAAKQKVAEKAVITPAKSID